LQTRKPAKPKEVVARVKAVLRRTNPETKQPGINEIQIDRTQYLAKWEGKELDLTRVEFHLLSLLASKPGQIFSRNQIMDSIYEDGRYVSNRSIDSHVKNLRHKLTGISNIENPIQSVYGVGYKLEINHD
jgi:two-component system response regulator BaeR